MNASLVVTLISADRQGLLNALTARAAVSGANQLENNMAQLAGRFAGIGRPRIAEVSLLEIEAGSMQLTIERDATAFAGVPRPDTKLELFGHDRPCIIHQVSAVLAREEACVDKLETASEAAPFSGKPLSRAGIEIHALTAVQTTSSPTELLYKDDASISGAEVGCPAKGGVACSTAAGAQAEVMGGTPKQVENAAEIGMEHNLELTCDLVGGLVQVSCIECNAMGSIKAINAVRMAFHGGRSHCVSLEKVINAMREIHADMKLKYKETACESLAVDVVKC